MRAMRNLVPALVLLGCLAGRGRGDEALPLATLQALKSASVFIKVGIGQVVGTGSGFLIRTSGDSGYVVTNHHVVAPRMNVPVPVVPTSKPKVTVIFWSGTAKEKSVAAEVLGVDEKADLAVLRVTGLRELPKPIEFEQTPKVVETMPVFVLGFPFGNLLTERKGKNPPITIGKASVSSLHTDDDGELDAIQLDGTLNPGNSGGPVVDARGGLVGIARSSIVSKQEGNTNISKAIPARALKNLLAGKVSRVHVEWPKNPKQAKDKPIPVRIELDIFDPQEKIKTVDLHYGRGPAGAAKKVADMPGARKLALTVAKSKAVATIELADLEKDALLSLQAEIVNAVGRKLWTPIQTSRPGEEGIAGKLPRTIPSGRLADRKLPPLPAEAKELLKLASLPGQRAFTRMVGGRFGEDFVELPTGGGLLIGFEVGLGRWGPNDIIAALRPIFWTEKGQVLGEVQGNMGERRELIVAKDGYAVAGIELRNAAAIDGMTVTYMRLDKGALNPKDSYQEFVGGPGGQPSGTLGGSGALVIGVRGKKVGPNCNALGLVLFKAPRPEVFGKAMPALPDETRAIISKVIERADLLRTRIAGVADGDPFEEIRAKGGLLIGFEVGLDTNAFKQETIQSLRPIFWTEKGELRGDIHGLPSQRAVTLISKEGYAVGGVEVKVGPWGMHSMPITYMRLKKDALDPTDSYQSDLLGGAGGAATMLGGNGALIVGVCGKIKGDKCQGLGLAILRDTRPEVVTREMPALPAETLTILNGKRRDRTHSKIAGFQIGEVFEEARGKGGLLIGFELGLVKSFNNDVIQAVRPIYWTGKGETRGDAIGTGERTVTIIAKDGYAVAGIEVRSDVAIKGLKVTFMRLAKRCLDPKDSYASEWIGGDGGQSNGHVGSDGCLVVGICGKRNEHCRALGLVMLKGTHPDMVAAPLSALPDEAGAFLQKAAKTRGVAKSTVLGWPNGDAFSDVAPAPGLLIGFVISLDRIGEQEYVSSMAPIYWTSEGATLGQERGVSTKRTVIVRAKDGFAVAAVEIKSALVLNSLRFTFMRVGKTALDPNDRYQSEQIGGPGGNDSGSVSGNGAFVIGFCGRIAHNNCCSALGLLINGDAK
ncbi:MAG: trypsin-like peptidase domain-containing protein [Planctomycetes bacterium]|nr:trypsin-like peptidase domain-containing protein [Planctomycetota bacterium]